MKSFYRNFFLENPLNSKQNIQIHNNELIATYVNLQDKAQRPYEYSQDIWICGITFVSIAGLSERCLSIWNRPLEGGQDALFHFREAPMTSISGGWSHLLIKEVSLKTVASTVFKTDIPVSGVSVNRVIDAGRFSLAVLVSCCTPRDIFSRMTSGWRALYHLSGASCPFQTKPNSKSGKDIIQGWRLFSYSSVCFFKSIFLKWRCHSVSPATRLSQRCRHRISAHVCGVVCISWVFLTHRLSPLWTWSNWIQPPDSHQ